MIRSEHAANTGLVQAATTPQAAWAKPSPRRTASAPRPSLFRRLLAFIL